jgi:hypothetical protein
VAILATAGVHAQQQTISRGHQLLFKHGLQIQAWVFPGWNDPGVTPAFDLDAWAQSNLTTATFIDSSGDASTFLGPPPGVPWGLAGYHTVSGSEVPYASNLVSIQYRDEQNLADPAVLAETAAAVSQRQAAYPNTLIFTNQIGGQFTSPVMQAYMAEVKPDMLMFDAYPFNGLVDFVPGGSPSGLYYSLFKYRALGLAGNDGTGQSPIPCGLYTQTFTMPQMVLGHVVTESEMRLNQFCAWVYGFKFVSCFFYDQPGPEGEELETILFEGPTSAHPKTEQFYQLAELNRQSRNLGPALLRLLSTDVRFVLGRYQKSPTDSIKQIVQYPGMTLWSPGQTVPFLTSVAATNLGTENYGLEGNVILGGFRALDESFDGSYADQAYFMVVNGLSSPNTTGTAANTRQNIHLTFDFGTSGITALQRMSRDTGLIEDVALVHEGGSVYSLDLVLDGGTGDLFKFTTAAPFLGDSTYGGEITFDHDYFILSGSRIELSVPADGSAYTWLRDGVALTDGGRIQGSTTNVLVLDPIAVEDSGTYVCHIERPDSSKSLVVTSSHQLIVIPAEDLPLGAPVMLGVLLAVLAAMGVWRRRKA